MLENLIQFSIKYKEIFTILHVLFSVIAMGAVFITDFIFIYFSKDRILEKKEIDTIKKISNIVVCGLILIIISGFFIFISNIDKYIVSAKFLTKMSILIILCINGFALHFFVFKNLKNDFFKKDKKNTLKRRLSFGLSAISITSWIYMLSLGVLDKINSTYICAILTYFKILIIAIIISQIIFYIEESRH